MSNPFKTDWSNIDLEREGGLEIISGKTFDILILELENTPNVDRKVATQHFEQQLRNIVREAREIFNDNLDNIVAYVNRDAIAEAAEAEHIAKDQETMRLLSQDLYSNSRKWRPISKERFDWMLECLPPLRMGRGGFVNSEPVDSLPGGEEVYFVGLKSDGYHFAIYGTVAEWDSQALNTKFSANY